MLPHPQSVVESTAHFTRALAAFEPTHPFVCTGKTPLQPRAPYCRWPVTAPKCAADITRASVKHDTDPCVVRSGNINTGIKSGTATVKCAVSVRPHGQCRRLLTVPPSLPCKSTTRGMNGKYTMIIAATARFSPRYAV